MNIFYSGMILSYQTTRMGFEPTTSAVTGRRSSQLNYVAKFLFPNIRDYQETYTIFSLIHRELSGRVTEVRTLITRLRIWPPNLLEDNPMCREFKTLINTIQLNP